MSKAAMRNSNPEVFRVLLENGANPVAMVGENPALAYVFYNDELTEALSKLPPSHKTKRLIFQAMERVKPLLLDLK